MDFTQTMLFIGTKNLLAAFSVALTTLASGITLAFAVKNGILWQIADDQEKPAKKKKFIIEIMLGILVITVGGILTVIFSAYGVSA